MSEEYVQIAWIGERARVFWYDRENVFHEHLLTAEQSEELSLMQSRHESREQKFVRGLFP